MNRQQALAKLKPLLGNGADYEFKPDAPDADERATLRAEHQAVIAERELAKERMDRRRRELLADPEYKALHKAWAEANTRADELSCRRLHHRITAGVRNGCFFHVRAQGDTWPEVLAKLSNEH